MSSVFDLGDMRELIKQFSPGSNQAINPYDGTLVPTTAETHLLSSSWIKKEFRTLCESSRERISLDALPSRFDITPSQCSEILKSEIVDCLLSSGRRFVIPKQEEDIIQDELKTISHRIGVSIKHFARGNDIDLGQMRDLVQKLNRIHAADNPIHLEILADGDALISKESHERYLTGIHKIMQTAQDQAIVQKLVQTSDFQDLKLPNTHALLLAMELLNYDHTVISGWLQDYSQDAVVFTPNSSIAEDLRTGDLQYVNMLEPVRRPCGEQQLIAKTRALLREQISKEGIVYITKDDIAFSSLWLHGLASQLDGDLSEAGIARVLFADLPSHIQSEVANLLTTYSPPDAIDGKNANLLLQTPCSRFGNLLISDKRRQSLEMALEQSARDGAAKQVESATAVSTFDSADALNGILKNEKRLSSGERNELRHGLLNREMTQRVKSIFEEELARGYDTMRERFRLQYCDRILFKADLAYEFNKSLKTNTDFAKILEETLEAWVQETLIPQNLKPQAPLSKLAQQCNDKSLNRKLDALKTQWRGIEDLRTFPPQYRIAELVDEHARSAETKSQDR
ncbi:hypothetical protein EV356DRAFT_33006 [Viridothelium virens]|uniref:Uncharacterized protein n=1 Tax=Viridothelium virens TaxID=1048519 RepID=A0A6A6GT63_VIRVR|nr:hypothetical protein EV356DRAFT_33006 [Viridothelium virens]